ncbi:SUMO-specific isopeptidase USPL1 [Hemiscyllium ocellatum]|uniref:SUMO-specific isopeptidase USPL1 n=1 Tax=Hemiscyllium ocellatum TaxID=170820 RepID=UPI00296672DA|nr:SUMO-specific isopeptidase USPL1 [Hemiscyllium ocellatum]
MVKVSLWLSMADKQKTKTGLPLSGPSTDINVSSSHTVGYLGKFSENTSLIQEQYCPACAAKGENKALRRFYISLEESVLLCESPQCVFPLGCKPLNEILISPTLPRLSVQAAKSISGSGALVPLCKRNVKRQKTSNCNNKDIFSGSCVIPKEAAYQPVETDLNKIDSFVPCSENGSNSKSFNSSESNGIVIPDKTIFGVRDQLCGKRKEPPSETEHSGQPKLEVPVVQSQVEQLFLQWKNKSALCWLDCVLIALVHLKLLRKLMPNLGTEMESPFKKLYTEYDQACTLVSNCQSHCKGNGLWKIPPETLGRIELTLSNVRESLFQLLRPKLKCKLGVPDSPVFAFPQLLRQDPYVEALFMQSYIWSFECMKCGYKYEERCRKTLITFTNIVSDWHPLNAVHKATCNNCQDKDQKRKMLLDCVSSIYMLHFVEGLPHADLDSYRFDFQGNSYRICTIIQYLQTVKHFVTWIQNYDGSWLECDDLKGSTSCRHSVLNVPAHEIHIVIWEKTDLENPTQSNATLSFSDSTSASFPTFTNNATTSVSQQLCETSFNSPVQLSAVKKPIFSAHPEIKPNTNCVKEGEQGTSSNNLLSSLEHLTDDAMVTLNLGEVKVDKERKPVDNTQIILSALQNDLQNKEKTLQNSPLVTQVAVGHDASVQPRTDIQYSKDISQQINQVTVIEPDMPQKYKASSWPPTPSQLQGINVAGASSALLQKDNVTSSNSSPTQERKTASDCSEMSIQSKAKVQKEDHTKIPVSENLKTSTINGSSADISQPLAAKKSFAVGWTRNLFNRHLSTLAGNQPRILPQNEVKNAHKGNASLKITDPKYPVKDRFDGFKTKYLSKRTRSAKELSVSQDSNNHTAACVQNDDNLPQNPGNMNENCKVLLPKTISSGIHTLNKTFLNNSSKCTHPLKSETGTCILKNQCSNSNKQTQLNYASSKAHCLRLKLLKKLQDKKDQLSSLEQLMKTKQDEFDSDYASTSSLEGQLNVANNGSMLYDDVLNELWRELGVENDKSVYSASSGASLNNSPGHDELLAELFTPATTTTTSIDVQNSDSWLCGRAANCKLSNECNIAPRTVNGDHIPRVSTLQVQSHKIESIGNCESVYESPTKEEMLVDLLSTSTLNSLTGDHDELPNFDENLFENC